MGIAYIFDFDGVLVNTMPASFSAYKQALAEVNVPIDEGQYYRQAGMTGQEQIRYFAEKAGIVVDAARVYARTREIRKEQPLPIDRIECNLDLLRILRQAGVPVAIATGSSHQSVEPIISRLGIEVDAIVASEDVQRGKPFPDLFLRAAEVLGVPPEDCTVIEDSDAGIEAARAAGMKAFWFFNKK